MTSIITSGCSFTEDPNSWANVLQHKLSKDHSVYNCAMGGVGQEYIVRSAMMKLHETKGPKICIAQFSGFSRIEINIEKQENPLFEEIVRERPDWEHSRKWYDLGPWKLTQKDFFILKTTDIGHHWWSKKPTVKKTLDAIDQIYGIDQRLCWTYENILKLQLYCKQNNIPLFCFWGWAECRPCYLDEGLDESKFPLAWKMHKLVDWDNFWLHNNRDGMAEWMIDNGHTGKLEEDHTNNPPKGYYEYQGKKFMIGHPTSIAHNDFCEKIIAPWVNNVLR